MPEGEYGKKNWVKLVLIYLVIGAIVYAAVWYFFLGGNSGGGLNYSAPQNTFPSY